MSYLFCAGLQSQLDLLVSAVSGLRQHLQVPGNALQVDLLLQGPGGVHMSPSQDETLKVTHQRLSSLTHSSCLSGTCNYHAHAQGHADWLAHSHTHCHPCVAPWSLPCFVVTSMHFLQALSKGVLEHMVGVLIAAPRLLKHNTIAALLEDPVNCNLSNFNRGSTPGTGSCYVSTVGGHKGPSVVSGKALRASVDAAAQTAAAVTLSAWLSEGDSHEGRREGGQLLMMVVGDKNLQLQRRTLDQHVGGCACALL